MDRRQQKTRAAIFHAFSRLLENGRYENITVQNIIDAANIGRSTFYAHFATKDELLRALCTDIFHHVFYHALPQENEQPNLTERQSLELKLGHILYHLKENEGNLKGLILSDSGALFLTYFKEYLAELFQKYPSLFCTEVPVDYRLRYLAGSFIETVKWWIETDMQYAPEQVAAFYMKMLAI